MATFETLLPPSSSSSSDTSTSAAYLWSQPSQAVPVADSSNVSVERRQSVSTARWHPGPTVLVLLIVLLIVVSLGPFFSSLAPFVTADAAYTPTFNTTDSRYTVTGTGRASFGTVFDYKDAFPAFKETVIDGVSQFTNLTYYSGLSSKAYSCNYSVYSTVTRVDRGFGVAGEVAQLTSPGCTALLLARVGLTAYMPLLFLAFIPTIFLWLMLHHPKGCEDVPSAYAIPLWYVAFVFRFLQLFFAVVQICGMWSFARSAGFSQPSLGAVLYVQPILVAFIAALAVYVLVALYRDAKMKVAREAVL